MRSFSSLSALAALVACAVAQNGTGTAGTNFTINVNSVDLTTRAQWCQGEFNTCTALCQPAPKENTCADDTLDFTCLCQNGSAPALNLYQESMPSFICQEAFSECISQNTGDSEAQAGCTTNIKDNCGTLLASSPTATGSGSTASGTGSSSSSAPSSSSSKGAAAAPTHMAQYGNGAAAAVAIGFLAYLA